LLEAYSIVGYLEELVPDRASSIVVFY